MHPDTLIDIVRRERPVSLPHHQDLAGRLGQLSRVGARRDGRWGRRRVGRQSRLARR